MPELFDMVKTYKPEYIWSDGDWTASSDYWDSKQFLAWLFNERYKVLLFLLFCNLLVTNLISVFEGHVQMQLHLS